EKTEVEEGAHLIGVGYWIAPKDVVFQNPRKRPCCTGIGGVSPAALPKVGQYTVKLSPSNCHLAGVCRINRDRTFVSRITDNVIPICIDVRLVADENAMRRDHSWRSLESIDIRWRVIVFFQRFISGYPVCGRQLS